MSAETDPVSKTDNLANEDSPPEEAPAEQAHQDGNVVPLCPFAEAVARKVARRAEAGLRKYGVTCAREDLDLSAWLTHLQEELMDAAVYIERAKYDLWRASEDSTLESTPPP